MAKAKCFTFLKIQVTDNPGVLLRLMQQLKISGISLKSLWGYSKPNGVADVFLIPKEKEVEKVYTHLTHEYAGIEKGTAFFIQGVDKAGALLKLLQVLAENNVNIRAIQAIAVSGKYGSMFWVNDADVAKVENLLC